MFQRLYVLNELPDITHHRPRPIRYSLTLIGLCFGASFVLHAAIVLGMWLSPVPPTFARSASASAAGQHERSAVRVSIVMHALPVLKPAVSGDEVSETEPPPVTPVAVPSLVDEGPEDAPAPTLPTAAKPPEPEAPLPIEPPSVALDPVLALDGPGADAADMPPAAVVEQTVTEAMKPESPQREAVAEVLAQAPEKPAEKVAEGSDAAGAGADRGAALADEPSGTLAGESELAKETASASPTQASQADASDDASPPIEADEPVQENASAAVYDEQSVDQPIAFDKMARPKPSAVSRRLKEAGTVRIRIEVDAQGRLLGYEVLDATEHPRLLAAALSALENSTFVAARRGDEAVRSTRVIEYRF